MGIKSKDLAALVGVSEATMSLVLNGKAGISEKTRASVTKKVIELGYGDLLATPTSAPEKTLGFILYRDSGKLLGENSFFPLIFDGIEQAARKFGYSLTVINIDKQTMAEDLSHIRDTKCRGFIVFATELHEPELSDFESLNIPFIIFDNHFYTSSVPTVKVNNAQGTYLAIAHLYQKGHRKIGYLSSGLQINSFLERQVSALNAMKHFGLAHDDALIYPIGYPHELAEEGMVALLNAHAKEDLPTAFLADNDLVAVGAMIGMKRKGYSIPDDFSIVGFDDRPICTMVEPKLTSVQLPRNRFGAEAVEQLVRAIDNPSTSYYITVEVNGLLVERGSVADFSSTLAEANE